MQDRPRILVIGDIMLDHYVSGKVTRISPEAPVPVVKVEREWNTLGGAANVAANAVSLGSSVTLLGLIGNDAAANTLRQSCLEAGILLECAISGQPTIVKTRVMAGQQIVRLDREEELIWESAQFQDLKKRLEGLVPSSDVILLSDYAKGTLSDEVLQLVFELASYHNKKVLVDPKRADWSLYRGAYIITPNILELAMTRPDKQMENDDNRITQACNELRTRFDLHSIVVTRSSYGMTVIEKNKVLNIPTRALEVFDVSGAGDTVLATLGVTIARGKSVQESAFVANAAAGIVVSKRGTSVIRNSELQPLLIKSAKIIPQNQIKAFAEKHAGQRMVFTNGCFDILHQGHRKLMEQARAIGDLLVVGLNSDESIKRLKGKSRPVNQVADRCEALAALPSVDAIIVFEEDTPLELLQLLRPHVLVKGGDYAPEEIVGHHLVNDVVIVSLLNGISTTGILEQ